MTDSIEAMTPQVDQQELAEQLVEQARADGVELIGPGGLLTGLTSRVINTALEVEMADHLGFDKHDPVGRNGGNSRNGTRTKTVLTELGPVPVEVPRDRDGTFEPQIVRKRQRRLDRIDEIVLSLTARGLTTGEVSAHFAGIYGATLSKDSISRITDQVLAEMAEWCARPLDAVYPVVFIDAIVVKIRDGQVTNRPIYVAVGVSVNGERDILGLWAGDGGEGAKFWLAVLTDLKNRGVRDVCMVVCDGLKGLPESITTTWSLAQVQTCILHLVRNTFRYASRARTGTHWPATCGRSTPQSTPTSPRPASASSPTPGAGSTRRSSPCGATPGRSSSRSSTTTWRSARSSAPPTRSSPSTPATAAPCGPADTSPPSRPP